MIKSQTIQYVRPCDGKTATYDPSRDGVYVVAFKPGVTQNDLWLGPLPSNRSLQLGYGSVGTPRHTEQMAQRDLAAVHAKFPEVAHHCAIYKTPAALCHPSARVLVTDVVDADVLKVAQSIKWDSASWFQTDAYHKQSGNTPKFNDHGYFLGWN